MIEDRLKEYRDDLGECTDLLRKQKVMRSTRHGLFKLRDYIILFKNLWKEGNGYFSILKDILVIVALAPLALVNVNGMLGTDVPPHIAYTVSMISVVGILVIGILSYTKFGFVHRSGEIGARISTSGILWYNYMNKILERVEKVEEKIDEIKKKEGE